MTPCARCHVPAVSLFHDDLPARCFACGRYLEPQPAPDVYQRYEQDPLFHEFLPSQIARYKEREAAYKGESSITWNRQ